MPWECRDRSKPALPGRCRMAGWKKGASGCPEELGFCVAEKGIPDSESSWADMRRGCADERDVHPWGKGSCLLSLQCGSGRIILKGILERQVRPDGVNFKSLVSFIWTFKYWLWGNSLGILSVLFLYPAYHLGMWASYPYQTENFHS